MSAYMPTLKQLQYLVALKGSMAISGAQPTPAS